MRIALDKTMIEEILLVQKCLERRVRRSNALRIGFLVYDWGEFHVFPIREDALYFMDYWCSSEALFVDLDAVKGKELRVLLNDVMQAEQEYLYQSRKGV